MFQDRELHPIRITSQWSKPERSPPMIRLEHAASCRSASPSAAESRCGMLVSHRESGRYLSRTIFGAAHGVLQGLQRLDADRSVVARPSRAAALFAAVALLRKANSKHTLAEWPSTWPHLPSHRCFCLISAIQNC